MTRKRKISPKDFITALAFSTLTQKERSLLDISNELDCDVSKVAIHKKFNDKAVEFVKSVLAELLAQSLSFDPACKSHKLDFKQLNIKDSTKISLPPQFSDEYPSYGGFKGTNTSLLNIQFEFNLMNNNWKEIKFTKVTQNDQSDSRDTLDDIVEGSLNIRDLGYITTKYLQTVEERNAFYINRLQKVNVYVKEDDKYKKIDWCEFYENDRNRGFTKVRELEVYLGKEKYKTRLILAPLPEKVRSERIRKAAQGGKRSKKSTRYNISQEHKAKLGYTLMITNIPKEKMAVETVLKAYSLRWQVELIFKAWKSNLKLDQIKLVNIYRMKCELYCKLIFALIASHAIGKCNHYLLENNGLRKKQISYPKMFKYLKTKSQELKEAVQTNFEHWVKNHIIPVCKKLTIEKKKGKTPSFVIINEIFCPLS